MNLGRFPRVKLCQAPTPLELLPNLTRQLGGPQKLTDRQVDELLHLKKKAGLSDPRI